MFPRWSNEFAAALLLCAGAVSYAQIKPAAASQAPPAPAAPSTSTLTPLDPATFLKAKKLAIVVGISAYPPESGFPALHFAAKDAQDLADALTKQGYEVQLLTDDHAMKSSIRAALSHAHDILSQDPNGGGTLLFAFSGHGGETVADAKQFLVTYDASISDPEPGYALKDLTDALNSSGATQRMMLLDACRDLTQSLSKGAPPLTSFHDLSNSSGIKIFFSTAPGTMSYEDAKDQNGYFTHYLLQGLNGPAADPSGLVTFDNLAKWVSITMKTDPDVYQVPYWNQNATGDFYLAGHPLTKEALVISVDNYAGHPLNSAIAGARQVAQQLQINGFNVTVLENANSADFKAKLAAFATKLGPADPAVFYFAGEGGLASGQPFLMPADATLPTTAVAGKWPAPPANAITLGNLMDIVGHNHAGPNIYFLDMGMPRASAADVLDLASLKRDHTLVLFSTRSGLDPARTADGSLFSKTVVSVLGEPNLSAGYAASKITSAIFNQSNGEDFVITLPMLPDRVYITPSN